MSVYEHDYGIPGEDELAMLVGAATPHFAFQSKARIEAYAERLPADHPRQDELARHIARLDRIGYGGETGGVDRSDLSPRASLPSLRG